MWFSMPAVLRVALDHTVQYAKFRVVLSKKVTSSLTYILTDFSLSQSKNLLKCDKYWWLAFTQVKTLHHRTLYKTSAVTFPVDRKLWRNNFFRRTPWHFETSLEIFVYFLRHLTFLKTNRRCTYIIILLCNCAAP